MCSNNVKKSIIKSYRFKLTLLNLVLTTITLLIAFSASYWIFSRKVQSDIDAVLGSALDQVALSYSDFAQESTYTIVKDKALLTMVSGYVEEKEGGIRILSIRVPEGNSEYLILGLKNKQLCRMEMMKDHSVQNISFLPAVRLLRRASQATEDLAPIIGILADDKGELICSINENQDDLEQNKIRQRMGALKVNSVKRLNQSHVNYRYGIAEIEGLGRCLIGVKLHAVLNLQRQLSKIFVILIALLIPVVALIGWFVAVRSMSGVERISLAAETIIDGNFDHRVPVMKEGTEIERLASSFNKMLDHIQLLIRELSDITSNVAHDLRTPITRIRTNLETADWGCSSPHHLQVAGEVIEECDNLVSMINTSLEISQAEADLLALETTKFDFVDQLTVAVELFGPLCHDKQITLTCSMPDHPVYFSGDQIRIQRIISNLLDNAIKYTPQNGAVTVSLVESETAVILTVEDTGVGIPEGDQNRIFERFYRCSNSRTEVGNGLGLSLVKALVDAHHGQISVSSTPEEGTTFTIVFNKR